MESEGVDPMAVATDELKGGMVLTPEDLLDDMGPLACLLYATQTLAFALGRFVGTVDSPEGADLKDGDGPVQALAAMTKALGVLHGACECVGLYPEGASEIPE